MTFSILAVGMGACLGALCRYGLNLALNSLFPALPPGTLVANLLGCLLMGVASACFAAFPAISQEWRLMLVTGFLGSLTTFSAFSGEIGKLVLEGRLWLGLWGIGLHVGGGLLMFFAGMGAFSLAKKIFTATTA